MSLATETPPRPEERPQPGKKPLTARQRENRAGLAYLSPTLIVVLVVVVLPIIWTVMLAFQRIRLINLRRAGVFGEYSMTNLETVLTSPGFWSSLWTTVVYTVGSTFGSIVLGLIAALALRAPFRGRTLVRASVLLPYVAPVVAVTFVWNVLLSPQFGLANDWGMRFLGWDRPIAFLSQREYALNLLGWQVDIPLALLTVIMFEAWRYFPFAFLFLLARLQAVPHDLEEAARVDGAAPTQVFRHILLPQLSAVIALLCVLRFIMTFNKFDDVYLLTGGGAGTEVVSVRVYEFLTARFDVGAAAAQALVLALGLVVLLAIYMRFLAPRVEGED
ncbi:carbohydrate ABC transporter permease [Actinoplanes aureus]|uniref:Sugar ABC transporter permease n=1 Tax=Actinoplanes aureus TaxID=2792083 RepID=A0A931C6U4_9ACTN|nr:sugar ABC transporter permease [Actinoplanes aureus]MBG0561191.1 sugar ABC transporter permease [Actinoplanes aureus]